MDLFLEIFNDQFRGSLPSCADAYRSHLHGPGDGAIVQGDDQKSKFAKGQPTGMDFIEFAVDKSEHQQLTGFLQRRGLLIATQGQASGALATGRHLLGHQSGVSEFRTEIPHRAWAVCLCLRTECPDVLD